MSAFAHSTLLAQPGRSLEAVTVSHWGSPERLYRMMRLDLDGEHICGGRMVRTLGTRPPSLGRRRVYIFLSLLSKV